MCDGKIPGLEGSQWGHVAIDVEMETWAREAGVEDQSQWGHVAIDVEMMWRITDFDVFYPVSMGPRRDRRGNAGHRVYGHESKCKSQWGHVAIDVEISSIVQTQARTSCLNGATSRSTWKSAPPPNAASAKTCLNGATSRSTWKSRERRTALRQLRRVSMGPRRDRRGNEKAGQVLAHELAVSMGPRRDRRGNMGGEDGGAGDASQSLNGATSRSTWKRCA